jgi:hypothetical protein
MPMFRKKTVVIEAVQFDGTTECANRIGLEPFGSASWGIQTLEGFMTVSTLDWVITGVKKERYPCKDEIFKLSYEQVES